MLTHPRGVGRDEEDGALGHGQLVGLAEQVVGVVLHQAVLQAEEESVVLLPLGRVAGEGLGWWWW